MAGVDPASLGIGAIVSVGLTGAANVLGNVINRRTSIDTKHIDDRGQFTKDLMAEVESLRNQVQDCEQAEQRCRARESALQRLIMNIGADSRYLYAVAEQHSQEADPHAMKLQARTVFAAVARMNQTINEELSMINRMVGEASVEKPHG